MVSYLFCRDHIAKCHLKTHAMTQNTWRWLQRSKFVVSVGVRTMKIMRQWCVSFASNGRILELVGCIFCYCCRTSLCSIGYHLDGVRCKTVPANREHL